jgi:predicted nucleic acid-binding protein
MNLDTLPANEVIVLDANVIIYALHRMSGQCQRLLERCVGEEVRGIVPAHILAEVMHQLMITEARDNGWIMGPNPARQLAEQPERVRSLARYQERMRDILSAGLAVEPVDHEDYLTAMDIQRQAGLLTNDAILAAVARRLRVAAIASADQALGRVEWAQLYAPDDVAG